MWMIYAALSALFAALTAIFVKVGVSGINPDLATAIRTVVILVITWSVVLFGGRLKEIPQLSGHHLLFLIISGAATGLSWLFYFKAMEKGNVAQVAAIDKLSVAFTIILAALFLGETLSLRTAIGAGLIIAGTIVIVLR